MRIMMILSVLFIIVLISLLKVIPSFATETNWWRGLRELFFQPKDFFELIVNTPLDISQSDAIQTCEFKLKYRGPYNIGIILILHLISFLTGTSSGTVNVARSSPFPRLP